MAFGACEFGLPARPGKGLDLAVDKIAKPALHKTDFLHLQPLGGPAAIDKQVDPGDIR